MLNTCKSNVVFPLFVRGRGIIGFDSHSPGVAKKLPAPGGLAAPPLMDFSVPPHYRKAATTMGGRRGGRPILDRIKFRKKKKTHLGKKGKNESI